MKPSLQKLQKFFRLEAERDYDNKAVFGGLESMLAQWEAEARADELTEDIVQAVTERLRDYGRLTPESREEALKGLWKRIKRQTGIGEKETGPQKQPGAPAPPTKKPEVETASQQKEKTPPSPPKAKKRRQHEKRPRPEGPSAALDASVTVLDGVGPKNAEKLAQLGVGSLGDMLYHFPRRYDDYSQLKPINRLQYGEEVTVIGTVQTASTRNVGGGKTQLVEVIINDGSGALRINWFNQPWLSKTLKEGTQVVLSGKVDQYLGRLQMTSPEWELLEEENLSTNRIVPVYPLTGGITQKWLRRMMNKVVSYWALRVEDWLPDAVIKSADLLDLPEALLQVHFPDSWEDLEDAQHRLAFDEIFFLQLGVLRQKRQWESRDGRAFEAPLEWLDGELAKLPFVLTGAQRRVLEDVRTDLSSGRPMNRLVQGDVGSGKTVIAALAAKMVNRGGAQAAVMAPTSILAEQHYQSFLAMLGGEGGELVPEQIRLLVGATPEAEKKEIRAGLQNGEIKVVVGTHALIEDPVQFADLQLAVIDEQHRFGVEQRAALREKGENPHLLVMTATPIPRSLALTIYGDLDISVLDEMPPGRQTVDTHILFPRERERGYGFIRNQLEEGHQAFIIYPLVEESDKSDSKAAVEEHERLQKEVFRKYALGLLHGRLKPAEKDEVMNQFREKEYHVLVSTSVVEVGVDIPNATVMMIEGANRFGLAQLHQFRGRVGRGEDKAHCLLIPESDDAVENERLQVMAETNDGFVLAEQDLEQRGPGEFLGTRQSGFSALRLASLTDVHLIEKARNEARQLIEKDPALSEPEHAQLAKTMDRFWAGGLGDAS